MEEHRVLDELPDVYAQALTLRDKGLGREAIAAALGIVPEAVGSLLRLGEAKLERILSGDQVRYGSARGFGSRAGQARDRSGAESQASTPPRRVDFTDDGAAEA